MDSNKAAGNQHPFQVGDTVRLTEDDGEQRHPDLAGRIVRKQLLDDTITQIRQGYNLSIKDTIKLLSEAVISLTEELE